MSITPTGHVAPGFDPVADAFVRAFDGRPEMGAGLTVMVRGETVVDLSGGVADPRTARPWDDTTLSVVFSCTKGVMALLAARLVQQGLLDYTAPVSRYWPEFSASAKSSVTVADVLSHRSGLSAPRGDLSLDDVLAWHPVVTALQAQSPLWEPGTAYAYHALTQGWLIGEVIRRITGESVGHHFRRTIGDPLNLDLWIGLPPEHEKRVATLTVGQSLRQHADAIPDGVPAFDAYWSKRAMTLGGAFPVTLVDGADGFNDPRVHAAEIPAAGGIASARALASLWSAVVWGMDGEPLLDRATRVQATRTRSQGEPHFAAPGPWPRWGMGFQGDSGARRYLTGSSFGHDGAGGQVAFADPEHGVGFAFLTSLMEAGDDRATAIIDALKLVLDAR